MTPTKKSGFMAWNFPKPSFPLFRVFASTNLVWNNQSILFPIEDLRRSDLNLRSWYKIISNYDDQCSFIYSKMLLTFWNIFKIWGASRISNSVAHFRPWVGYMRYFPDGVGTNRPSKTLHFAIFTLFPKVSLDTPRKY